MLIKRATSTVFLLLAAALAIFYLPYHVPFLKRIASDSYALGFNNSAAIAASVLFFILFSFHEWRTKSPAGISLNLFGESSQDKSEKWDKKTFWAWALFYLFSILMLYFLLQSPYYFGERSSFLRRIDLILLGKTAYIDFEFGYGPALIYLPAWFYRLISPLGVDKVFSYNLCFAALSVAGLWLLHYFIDQFDISNKEKNVIFSVFALLAWNVSLGMNFTLTRYILPFAGLFILNRCYNPTIVGFLSVALGLAAVNFAISPEIGIVFCLAVISYLIYMAIYADKRAYLTLALFSLAFLLTFVWLPASFLRATFSFGAGGANFPVVPSLPVLTFFFCLFLILPKVAALAARSQPTEHKPLYLSLIILVLLMLPGALGRADPGHILWYGLALFILSAVIMLKLQYKHFKIYFSLFILIFVSGFILHYAANYAPSTLAAAYNNYGKYILPPDKAERFSSRMGVKGPDLDLILQDRFRLDQPDYNKIDNYPALATPLRTDDFMDRLLKQKNKYVPEYFTYIENIFTPEHLQRKINDLNKNRYLLVLDRTMRLSLAEPNYESYSQSLTLLLSYPISYQPRNDPFDPKREFVKYLNSHYRKIEQVGEYAIYSKEATSCNGFIGSIKKK